MSIGNKVLVQSFPTEPLVRQIYHENDDSVLVWRGTARPDDMPAPCPKNCVFIYEPDLVDALKKEFIKNGSRSPELETLWSKARLFYENVDNDD